MAKKEYKVPKIFKEVYPEAFVNPVTKKPLKGEESAFDSLLMSDHKKMWEFFNKMTAVGKSKLSKIRDYEQMIKDPVTLSAVEMLAEDTFQLSEQGDSVKFYVKNKKIGSMVQEFLDRIRIEERIEDWAFSVPFYGEMPVLVRGVPDEGIVSIMDSIHPLDFHRIDAGSLYGFMTEYEKDDKGNMLILPPWEAVHFIYKKSRIRERLTDRVVVEVDGKKVYLENIEVEGCLEGVRYIQKNLRLVEDSMVMARLDRAPLKRVFYIDVGDATPEQKVQIMKDFKANYKREVKFDSNDYYDSKSNPLAFGQELFIPISEGLKGIDVEEYGGKTDVSHIVDIEYLRNKYFAGLKIPKAFLGLEECLRYDTKIRFVDGSEAKIGDIANNFEAYKDKPVFTCSPNGSVSTSYMYGAKKTRLNASFVRVHLDNGEYVDATPDHPFMLRDGSFKEAGSLSSGESLMPLYLTIPKSGWTKGYLHYKDNRDKNVRTVHRLVADNLLGGIPEGYVVHHKDSNRLNNIPSNLEVMSKEDHRLIHKDLIDSIMSKGRSKKVRTKVSYGFTQTEEYRKKMSEAMKGRIITEEHRNNISKALKGKKRPYVSELNKDPERIDKVTKGIRKAVEEGRFDPYRNLMNLSEEQKKKKEVNYFKAMDRMWSQRERKQVYEVTCAYCGKVFERKLTPSVVAKGYFDKPRYCSVLHQRIHRSKLNSEAMKHNVMVSTLPNNHKVVKVEVLDVIEDAYDIQLDHPDHTFGLSAGIFVHNSLPGSLGESALVRMEIRYARSVKANRRAVLNGLFRLAQIDLGYRGIAVTSKDLQFYGNYISSAEEEDMINSISDRSRVASDFMRMFKDLGIEINDNNKEYIVRLIVHDLMHMTNVDLDQLLNAVKSDDDVKDEMRKFISESLGSFNNASGVTYSDSSLETWVNKDRWVRRFSTLFRDDIKGVRGFGSDLDHDNNSDIKRIEDIKNDASKRMRLKIPKHISNKEGDNAK